METKGNALVSVIVPFYNTGTLLRRCVKSMTAQTYTNLEIMLVDDGSEDDSVKIAEELAADDKRVRVLRTEHSGVSATRNEGLEQASGRYILFVDSDDWMSRTVVGHMVEQMTVTDADLVTCELIYSDGMDSAPEAGESDACSDQNSPSVRVYTRDEYMRLFFRIDSNEWVHFPVAKLYKKELLMQPLYPVGIRIGEDVVGTYRAIMPVKKIVRLDETGYFYYLNPQSVTVCFSEKDFDLIEVWDQMVSITEGKEPDHAYAKINRNRVNFTLLFRMITEVPAADIRKKYSSQQKQLLENLRNCEQELLRSPIVSSRKNLIRLLCHCYPVMAAAGNMYVLYKRARGKEPSLTRRKLS